MTSNSCRWLILLLCLASSFGSDYKSALSGFRYEFPRDYFNHPDYQTEWWYYTGNLKSDDGHRFGFELTFFRQGVDRRSTDVSDWSLRDLYLAHLALSDITGQKFYSTERLNRMGPGLAGIDGLTGMIWNGNWQVHLAAGDHKLQAVADDFQLRFTMKTSKPVVIHGRSGVSQKSETSGNASHYVSFSRLLTGGTIELQGRNYQVEGTSWMDHEFFTAPLENNETGWDWISIQLLDNTEVMLYRLRRRDGSVEPYSSGTYIDEKGNSTFLSLQDFDLRPTGEKWESAASHASYPVSWNLRIPKLDLELAVTTPLKTQELVSAKHVGPSYWEGAIDVSGTRAGAPIHGIGYLEMTGYESLHR